ncbi:alpha/beta fold hydrolase [Cohnella silvisoli]|uniref:Alpha/beta fold hydrolase n=1 Tax=Cohnella silvisoli TaxID=2873699 RepID=A0ABV1KPP6_9BACL|nr:alpha/beta fold hydrolase [Cohnella silvisoli]MCD9022349.1 alpha/beta fold hydrolase [Cohnella silvisoli]
MNRIFPLAIALALLLTTIPMTAAATGIKFKLIVDNKTLVMPDAQPYKGSKDVMIPLNYAAQSLGIKVSFNKNTKEVQLTKSTVKVSFKLGSSQAVSGASKTVTFKAPPAARQNRLYVPLSFFTEALGFKTSFNSVRAEAIISTLKSNDEIISTLVKQLSSGAYQQLSDDYFDDTVKQAIPVKALQAGWEQVASAAGNYVGIQTIQQNPKITDSKEINVLIEFSKTNVSLIVNLNDSNKVIGMRLNLVQPAGTLPASLAEEEVVVGAGTAYPLHGTLTLPRNASGPLPAVVLVQGSGPSDRDESAGGYKPFRDLAWGLAQQGIAVLRYDKRTFVYGKSFTPDMIAKFTVKEETIDDAIAASKLLNGDKRIDAARVYIAGHSLGGMLAPRIDAEGGNFAGLVIMAGSTRSLWEISADQNKDFIQAMDDKDPAKKTNEAWLASELLKAQNIRSLSDSEAMAQLFFGIPAYYFKEMDSHNTKDIISKLAKPIFVLQGQDDFQVYANKDYLLWQDQLKGNPNAAFKLYLGLNHFFVNYDGKGKNTTEEYQHPGNVDSQVIQDIANWINKK